MDLEDELGDAVTYATGWVKDRKVPFGTRVLVGQLIVLLAKARSELSRRRKLSQPPPEG